MVINFQITKAKISPQRPRESSLASKQRTRQCITRDDGRMVITLSSKLKLVWISPNIQNKLNILGQKLTARKHKKSVSSEIVLDNPTMDIDQGDSNSPNPGSVRLWDA